VKPYIALWKARMDTEHFTFEAYGDTKFAARRALVGGLLRHAEEYRIPDIWWSHYRDDIQFTQITAGVAYRDGEELRKRGEKS